MANLMVETPAMRVTPRGKTPQGYGIVPAIDYGRGPPAGNRSGRPGAAERAIP